MAARLTVCESDDAIGSRLAREIIIGMQTAATEGRPYILGCPTGRSPRSTYRALAALVAEQEIDLRHLVIAIMDEYVEQLSDGTFADVSHTAHFSCHRYATEEIVGPLNRATRLDRRMPADHLWFPDPADPTQFDHQLEQAGGVDLFIVASGSSDGHVAFNPPGTARDSVSRIVELAESTRLDNMATFPAFSALDEVPRYGVTVGVGTIARLSRRVALVAAGEGKQVAVRRASVDDYDPAWPASVVAICPGSDIYADPAAAPHVPLTGQGVLP